MRVIMIEWMMEVHMEFMMKKETLSKIEEILSPRVADFVKSTDGAYTGGQIAEMEIKLIKKLKFKLNPTTICTWLSCVTY